MGFLSIIENKEIYSFMLNDEQWMRLKDKYKYLSAVMPCCSTPAIPKKINLTLSFLHIIHLVPVISIQVKAVNINYVNTLF